VDTIPRQPQELYSCVTAAGETKRCGKLVLARMAKTVNINQNPTYPLLYRNKVMPKNMDRKIGMKLFEISFCLIS
jgi:hypothetical protein